MLDLNKIKEAQEAWRIAIRAGDEAAEQAAQAATLGCRESLLVLTDNLERMGYPVKSYFTPCANGLDARLTTIEKAIGEPVPPVLKLFWRTIGGVSLVDLDGYAHTDFWSEQGVYSNTEFCDGVSVDDCGNSWSDYIVREFHNWKDEVAEGDPEDAYPFVIDLSPDGYHKDNISGGSAYGVLPGAAWNPVWKNFAWTGPKRPKTAPPDPCDFLSYLRTTILECAGFPGLYGAPEFEPIRERLLAGVPIF